MYALPIFRRPTENEINKPKKKIDTNTRNDLYKNDLSSALKLVNSINNHYTCIIRYDSYGMAQWGAGSPVNGWGMHGFTSHFSPEPLSFAGIAGGIGRIIRAQMLGYVTDGYLILITDKNQLIGCGSNSHYIMNLDKTGSHVDSTDSMVLISDNVIEYSCGKYDYIVYLKDNGKVYGLGPANTAFGPKNSTNLIRDIGTDENYLGIDGVKKVITLPSHTGGSSASGLGGRTFCILNDGTVKAVGNNYGGSLGVNSADPTVTDWTTVVDNFGIPIQNVRDITGCCNNGYQSVSFLTFDGYIYSAGCNNVGQLGLGMSTSSTVKCATKISDISKAIGIVPAYLGMSLIAYTTDNKLWSWGYNSQGELGLGNKNVTPKATQAVFPNKKIKMAHGGGVISDSYAAFGIITEDGCLYVCGYNGQYALGLNNGGASVYVFTKNLYFGPNPEKQQNTYKYPLIINGSIVNGSNSLITSSLYENKLVILGNDGQKYQYRKDIDITTGMVLSGDGIQTGTTVSSINKTTNEIIMSKPATKTNNNISINYDRVIKAYQVDICGYTYEQAMKVVTEDATLYISGWNQNRTVTPYWNFNPYIHVEQVEIPTEFDKTCRDETFATTLTKYP